MYPLGVPLTLPSFAKVNLHLRVLGKREDGYHEVFTVLQTVSLYDTLTFEKSLDGVTLECDHPDVPLDGSNLILQAAEILKRSFRVSGGVRIRLGKNIPMGGGLGGGSSNAAVTLIGLSRLWGIKAEATALRQIGERLGSDVPFFLEGGTAIGFGRGGDIEPARDFGAEWMIVATPNVHVSTAEAYAGLRAENLTNEASNRILRVCRSGAEPSGMFSSAAINDFEDSVFASYPEIGMVKRTLIELGASQAMMSGSGSSVFAIFDKEETRRTALKALDKEVNWRKFAVAAVSREEYRERLGLDKFV